jgi:signal peptidase II
MGADIDAVEARMSSATAQVAVAPRVRVSSIAVRLAAVAALVAADLWSKAAVFRWLGGHPTQMTYDGHGHHRYAILGDWFGFMLSWNPGMAWGFDKLPPWLLVCGRVAAVVFLLWLVARQARTRRWLTIALVLILAGALGNLYDNLFLPPQREDASFGSVRDFIDVYFKVWDWHFPTFNVADSCISVGAVLLFISSFVKPRAEAAPTAPERP